MTFSRTYHRLIVVLAVALGGVPLAADEPDDELKSAIVLSLLRYSTWKSALAAGGPLTVGVLGRSPLRHVLERQLEGKSVDNRLVHIMAVKSAGDPCRCQAIYIVIDERADVKQALEMARSARALSIGESDRFLEYGGAVNLFLADGHMSVEVSVEAIEEEGTDISSRLLRMGQVRRKRPA